LLQIQLLWVLLGFVGYCWVLAGKAMGKVKNEDYLISYGFLRGLFDLARVSGRSEAAETRKSQLCPPPSELCFPAALKLRRAGIQAECLSASSATISTTPPPLNFVKSAANYIS
jgi:hypothetical protein